MRAALLPLAVLLVALTSPACGGEQDDGVFVELLRFVPDVEGSRSGVAMFDMERHRAILGVAAPSGDLTWDDDIDYLLALTEAALQSSRHLMTPGQPPWFGRAALSRGYEFLREQVGVGVAGVDALMASGSRSVMRGQFDAERWEQQLARCDVCAQPDVDAYRGWRTYAWQSRDEGGRRGEFDLDVLEAVALRDGYWLNASTSDELRTMIDTREGHGSLAEYEPYRLSARELGRLGTVDAILSDFTQGPDWAELMLDDPRVRSERLAGAFSFEEMTVLAPYVAFATGGGVDEDGTAFTAVVLVHEHPEVAADNAARLPRRFDAFLEQDLFTEMTLGGSDLTSGARFESIAVEQSDALLVVRLYGGGGRQFQLHDAPLFLHE